VSDTIRPASHTRVHASLLAGVETRVLVWIAAGLPRRMTPDHLTALGAVAMLATGAAFAAVPLTRHALLLVPVLLAINWFGDSLDGTLARVRGQQRPRYGYYVDHVVDILNATMLFGGMAISGIISPWIAGALLVGYLLLCAESFLATHALGIFRISFGPFGPTELRILLSIGALAAIVRPVVDPFGLGTYRLFDVGGVIGAAGMLTAFIITAVRNTRALYAAEPLTEPA